MTHETENAQPVVVPTPSPARKHTTDNNNNVVEDDERAPLMVRGSINSSNTPSRPNNNTKGTAGGSSNVIGNYMGDSPARHSHDSSMNYHRMEDASGRGADDDDNDRVPLRESQNGAGYNGVGGGDGSSSPNNNNNQGKRDNLYAEDGALIPSPTKDGGQESDPNSPGDDVPETPLEHHVRTNELYKRAIFSTIPVFMAYASMITLQRSIKDKLGITNDDHSRTDLFGVAVGNLYLGNLIFRLLHNVLFSFMIPRHRTMLSYSLLCLNHLIVGVAYWIFNSDSLVWTFIAYLLAGVGIGTFESNLLSCLSPLGHGTKSWAVIGIPIGFNGVSVGFYILFAIEPHLEWLKGFPYFFIAVCNLLGLGFFTFGLPNVEYAASKDNVVKFKEDLCRYQEWFPRVRNYCFALCADMFCVSMFSSIVYYIYDMEHIPLWPYAEPTIPKNIFQVWYNFCSFLGDFSGRKIAYRDKTRRNPYMFLIFSVCGIAMIMSKVVLLAPFGMFCIMFANGSIYAHTTKHIDNVVDDRFILIALSVWLFVGDIGSYVASLIVQPLQVAFGAVPVRDDRFFNNTLPGWWDNVTYFPTLTTTTTGAPPVTTTAANFGF